MQSGNALITHHSGEWYCNTDNRTPANASKLRQGHHALGVDGKLLTELLDRRDYSVVSVMFAEGHALRASKNTQSMRGW